VLKRDGANISQIIMSWLLVSHIHYVIPHREDWVYSLRDSNPPTSAKISSLFGTGCGFILECFRTEDVDLCR
jgi:hypothetical protein